MRMSWARFHSSITFLGFAVMLVLCVQDYCRSDEDLQGTHNIITFIIKLSLFKM